MLLKDVLRGRGILLIEDRTDIVGAAEADGVILSRQGECPHLLHKDPSLAWPLHMAQNAMHQSTEVHKPESKKLLMRNSTLLSSDGGFCRSTHGSRQAFAPIICQSSGQAGSFRAGSPAGSLRWSKPPSGRGDHLCNPRIKQSARPPVHSLCEPT